MKGIIAISVSIGSLAAIGQTPKTPEPPKPPVVEKAPVVSDAIKLAFFKAEFEFTQANEQAQAATQAAREKQAALQVVVKQLSGVCGDKFEPQLSSSRDPECIPKPEVKKSADKPPAK